MSDSTFSCAACRGELPRLSEAESSSLLAHLDPGWRVVEQHHLAKAFTVPDFREALAFANRIGAAAEAEGHHPELRVAWGRVDVAIWTHKVDGLTGADFTLASHVDRAFGAR